MHKGAEAIQHACLFVRVRSNFFLAVQKDYCTIFLWEILNQPDSEPCGNKSVFFYLKKRSLEF